MKKNKTALFVAVGSFLALLLLAEELFLILSAVNIFPEDVDETVMNALVIAPAVITLIYAFFSLLQKTERFTKSILPCLISIIAAVFFVFICFMLLQAVLVWVITAVAGVLMFIAGFPLAEKISSYGILCVNTVFFSVTYIAYGMISFHSRSGANNAIWTMILLPALCAFIIADMVSVAKNRKYKEFCEVKKQA